MVEKNLYDLSGSSWRYQGFFFQYANECDVIEDMIKYTKTFWSRKTSCMNRYCLPHAS